MAPPKWFKAPIVDVVDHSEWQKLRSSLVGTWKENAPANVKKLKKFLGPMTDVRRVRIVYNYLTGSAFRLGKIQHKSVTALLNKVRKAYKGLKAKHGVEQ